MACAKNQGMFVAAGIAAVLLCTACNSKTAEQNPKGSGQEVSGAAPEATPRTRVWRVKAAAPSAAPQGGERIVQTGGEATTRAVERTTSASAATGGYNPVHEATLKRRYPAIAADPKEPLPRDLSQEVTLAPVQRMRDVVGQLKSRSDQRLPESMAIELKRNVEELRAEVGRVGVMNPEQRDLIEQALVDLEGRVQQAAEVENPQEFARAAQLLEQQIQYLDAVLRGDKIPH